jgi:Ala-tRNA(Pro) deacylase
MNAPATVDRPYTGLLDWLAAHGVEHDVHKHDETYTAQSTARAEGVDPRTFAKVLGVVTDDGRRALFVLDAPDHLDMRKARQVLAAREVRLMSEKEMAALAPDCAPGAMPAVGSLFGLAMHADYAVRDDPAISFNAGSHRFSVRVDRAQWERAADVHYVDLAAESDARPTWARS